MTSEATWKRRVERRKLQMENQAKRRALRPLRTAVNKALKDAGIPHSVTHYSSRVRGWPISTSDGWETETIIWEPSLIYVDIYAKDDKKQEEYCQQAELKFMELFNYTRDGHKFQVYGWK